ncbi:LuxR C-terminal-related transcriptional regulator [Elizabethkingia anophelis]|uniref:response regulator transcription factor n=1 Tax=Elizabethkingia anophelis TaxID=1117645 RepID=UPI0029353931|nr:hypothetical protein [Elizabethkingia anophelis]
MEKNILIVTNQYIIGAGITAILSSKIDRLTVECVKNDNEIYSKIEQNNYNIVILDSESDINNNNIINELKKLKILAKIIIYTSYNATGIIQNINKDYKNFLNKYAQEDEILSLINNLLECESRGSININSIKQLSPRELQIFHLLVKGYSNNAISKNLNLKMPTVSTYKNRIFKKLEVNTIAELINIKHIS